MKEKLRFLQGLLIFSAIMFALTWIIVISAWWIFPEREIPFYFKEMGTFLFAATIAVYSAKTCIENCVEAKCAKDLEIAELECSTYLEEAEWDAFEAGLAACDNSDMEEITDE